MKVSSIEQSQLGRALGANASGEQGKAVMQDFTLVIPTYNRPKPLAALLKYLEAAHPPCRILVLDSSQPQPRAATRKLVQATNLALDYLEFPSETHPFDKFREGVHKVTTEFCEIGRAHV